VTTRAQALNPRQRRARTIRSVPRGPCLAALGLALASATMPRPASADPVGAAAILATVPAEEQEQLRKEKVLLLAGGDTTHVTGLVIFDEPVDRVMALLSQTGRGGEFRPELENDETVEAYPDGTVQEEELGILFTHITYFLRYRVDPSARRITWDLDPTRHNDIRQVSGSWELYDMGDGRTLARFGVEVDVGALPAFLQEYATRKKVPTTLENARRWIDSDGRWRP
jgi:hypothetical protein